MNHPIDQTIWNLYESRKQQILQLSDSGQAEECMTHAFDLLMFMNRFRNCDLKKYFDTEIHEAIARLNPSRYDCSNLIRPKKTFRIAYLITNLSDTGGASVPARFILDNPDPEYTFEQFLVVTNLRNQDNHERTEEFRYVQDELDVVEFEHFPAGLGWVEKGERIQQWLYDRQIDFLVLQACPSSLYALASKPVLLCGILNQDCYTFTIGPGCGDFTYFVTTDQIFKYDLPGPDPEKQMRVVMLPLPSTDYIESAMPIPRSGLGVPEGATVSASTNMWKSCFGDTEVLLEGIAVLIRKNPEHHHLFAGTPRCLDNVDQFLARNPDLRGNIRYIGPIKNIYRLLKSLDFWINSFPTSGGSDIECAMVGIPTIELVSNRNLNLHPAEFLRAPECDVTCLDEFVRLGDRFITDRGYRHELGAYLHAKISREFNKNRLLADRIYRPFIQEFHRQLANEPQLPGLCVAETIEYEKHIALYNAHGRHQWTTDQRREWLEQCIDRFPRKAFAWVKIIELVIEVQDRVAFERLSDRADSTTADYRVCVLLALGWKAHGDLARSLTYAETAAKMASMDHTPKRVAARIALEIGDTSRAAELCTLAGYPANHDEVREVLAGLPSDDLPLYYEY